MAHWAIKPCAKRALCDGIYCDVIKINIPQILSYLKSMIYIMAGEGGIVIAMGAGKIKILTLILEIQKWLKY